MKQTVLENEEILWKNFLAGDDGCLEKIYRFYFDELYDYGNKWLKNISLTEDSIQDLFIKLINNRKNLSPTTSIKYYLFRAFRMMVLDKLKAQRKVQFIDTPSENLFILEISPENKIISKEEYNIIKDKLSAAINTLTPRQREAIFLRYIEGFSYEQVADMMELTQKGTYKLMARAIEALKENMIPLYLLLFQKLLY